jgi:hypothetical protein
VIGKFENVLETSMQSEKKTDPDGALLQGKSIVFIASTIQIIKTLISCATTIFYLCDPFRVKEFEVMRVL